jgi:hypothetical protein
VLNLLVSSLLPFALSSPLDSGVGYPGDADPRSVFYPTLMC